MRNKIEYIGNLIGGFAKQFKHSNNQIITSEFTDDPKLKAKVKTLFDMHETMQYDSLTLAWQTTNQPA